jgi:hypothetical protein
MVNSAKGTKGSSDRGSHTEEDDAIDISSTVSFFTTLSQSERAGVELQIESLTNTIREELVRISSNLRCGEGRIFKQIVTRYYNVLRPVTTALEGIRIPLDAYAKNQEKITIFIPEDLEKHADSRILHELMRYSAHISGVELQRVKGDIPDNDQGNWFVSGYITELLSDQAIKRIRYNKDAPYMLGRACARVKLALAVIDQSKIPTKFLQIPDRFLGGTKAFSESELSRALKIYYTADRAKHLETLLQTLSTHAVRVNREEIRKKIDESLFSPIEEVIHALKRKTTKTVQSKRGKPMTSIEALTPTKPSQLATVAPWERSTVSDLYEQPWTEEDTLINSFKETNWFERDYHNFSKKLGEIMERQWGNKQKILRVTSPRLNGYPENQGDLLYKKLNWIREYLRSVGDLASLRDEILINFDPVVLIPSGDKPVEGKPVNWMSAYLDGHLDLLSPHLSQLIGRFKDEQNRRRLRNEDDGGNQNA